MECIEADAEQIPSHAEKNPELPAGGFVFRVLVDGEKEPVHGKNNQSIVDLRISGRAPSIGQVGTDGKADPVSAGAHDRPS